MEDIKILPDGVKTAIGENGINLSGGQKTRVSLGRALYSQTDIYLFDDILSAVDVHVAEHILREAVGKILKGKTVIMATHATKFAHFADRIILMNAGNIIAEGNPQTITNMK
jgi:ABC-type multidrug transport system fused ATPase/permease subunit